MFRREIHRMRRHDNSSTDASDHASEYNADAATARVPRMGPGHRTTQAIRRLEQPRVKSTHRMYAVTEEDGEETEVSVSLYEPRSPATVSLSTLDRRITRLERQVRALSSAKNALMQGKERTLSLRSARQKYDEALGLQEELRRSMSVSRQLRNQCKQLEQRQTDKEAGAEERRALRELESRLDKVVVTIEELQESVEEERKRAVKLFEDATGTRRSKSRMTQG